MNKKILNIIKIVIVIYIIGTLVFSLIVSQSENHLDICNQEYCIVCDIIHFAQNIINLSIVFVVAIMVGVLIYFFLSRLYKEKNIFVQATLVSKKIQLNE